MQSNNHVFVLKPFYYANIKGLEKSERSAEHYTYRISITDSVILLAVSVQNFSRIGARGFEIPHFKVGCSVSRLCIFPQLLCNVQVADHAKPRFVWSCDHYTL